MVKMAEGTPVIVSAGIEQDFKITPEQLEAAITPKTKALILCSPSNPTGSVYTKEELAGLSAVLAKHPQVIVIADEIYEHINYIGKHPIVFNKFCCMLCGGTYFFYFFVCCVKCCKAGILRLKYKPELKPVLDQLFFILQIFH